MNVSEVLIESFDRLPALVRAAVQGLDAERLRWAPAPGANSVGWLVWHLTRVQDHHVSALLDQEQVWVSDDWASRFGLDPDPRNTDTPTLPTRSPPCGPTAPGCWSTTARGARPHPQPARPGAGGSRPRRRRAGGTRRCPSGWAGQRRQSATQHVGQAAYVRGLQQRTGR